MTLTARLAQAAARAITLQGRRAVSTLSLRATASLPRASTPLSSAPWRAATRSFSSSSAAREFKNPYAGARAPNAEELEILASTIPVLQEHGFTLTTRFYKRMLGKHPELKNVFNLVHQETGMQPKALAEAVLAYAQNLTNLGALGQAVRHITHRHASLSILPEQYLVVGENLLAVLGEMLKEAGMPKETIDKIIAAWGVAYGQLSNILIEEEERLYRLAEQTPGGWRGWRKFVVQKKVEETAEHSTITSFYLVPKDGGALPSYLPGQFTTVRGMVQTKDGESIMQPRQYSLSAPSNEKYFRITVKREDAMQHPAPPKGCPMHQPAGQVSSWLYSSLQVGSEVELAPPFGEFHLNTESKSPVVLLGGGVGLTPLATMLDTAVQLGRPVSLLYACRSSAYHPLKEWFAQHKKEDPKRIRVWYNEPAEGDKEGVQFDQLGVMDITSLTPQQKSELLPQDADYYICGPLPFMKAQLQALRALGIKEEQLHAELFGAGSI